MGQLEHESETVEELVENLLAQRPRANLESGAAGLFVLSLVSDHGGKQPTINSSGSRLAV